MKRIRGVENALKISEIYLRKASISPLMRRTTYRKRQGANVMLLVGDDQSAGVASAFITPSRRHMAQNKTAPCLHGATHYPQKHQ